MKISPFYWNVSPFYILNIAVLTYIFDYTLLLFYIFGVKRYLKRYVDFFYQLSPKKHFFNSALVGKTILLENFPLPKQKQKKLNKNENCWSYS